ncbi:MAG: DUF459 domain-containing protein [Desulfovibrio sp.]|jgi:hypothetical protein|nr:DUF459 domain-containing protein [Desulfovibrio sp.]
MSSGRKKHASSGARAKQRKKRGKKAGVQFPLPVDNGLPRADATVADAREAAVCAEGPVPGDAPTQKTASAGGNGSRIGLGAQDEATPKETASCGTFPASAGVFLPSGRAFILAACVCLLLLVLESERGARYLDEFAPGAAAEKAASLLRAIGKASGAAGLGAWEDSLIRRLAGNTPAVRQKTTLSAGADDPERNSRGVETAPAPVREPASGPSETAGVRAGTQAVPEVSVLPATRAASGQQNAPDASKLPAELPAVHGAQRATSPQAVTATTPQTATSMQAVTVTDPPAATAQQTVAKAAPQAETAALRVSTAPQAAVAPPFPADAPQESVRAGAVVPAGSALPGATLASLPENSGLEGAGKERKTVLLVGDSMMGWGLGHVLERSMRAYPWISVKRYSRPSTGLCRITDVDWPKYLDGLVAEHSPDLVVISIGANDGSTMTDLNRRACTVFTPAWEKEYRRRAEEFVHIAGSRGAKVLWVGLPIAGVDKIEKVLRTVSRLQQDACAKFDFASYLDVRAVLADKNGQYTTFRPGNNAEPVRIRAADKVHVSTAGGKLLTDYIMPSVLKTLGGAPQGVVGDGRGTARAKSVARAGKAGG